MRYYLIESYESIANLSAYVKEIKPFFDSMYKITKKVTNASSTITTEKNEASIEREEDRVDVSINAIKDNQADEGLLDGVAFSFKFPINAISTGSYKGSIASTVDGKLALYNLHNDAEIPFFVEVTKVQDNDSSIHIEGDIDVITEDNSGNTFDIKLHFNVDASQRTLNGEAVHSNF